MGRYAPQAQELSNRDFFQYTENLIGTLQKLALGRGEKQLAHLLSLAKAEAHFRGQSDT